MTASLTGEAEALFTVLRQSADSETVARKRTPGARRQAPGAAAVQ